MPGKRLKWYRAFYTLQVVSETFCKRESSRTHLYFVKALQVLIFFAGKDYYYGYNLFQNQQN
ncbi:MAG: hypothetical protein JWP81_3040 [Ferruginibacter sp.]|nr:hypothetical protein [Ferruginibacter sp.]